MAKKQDVAACVPAFFLLIVFCLGILFYASFFYASLKDKSIITQVDL